MSREAALAAAVLLAAAEAQHWGVVAVVGGVVVVLWTAAAVPAAQLPYLNSLKGLFVIMAVLDRFYLPSLGKQYQLSYGELADSDLL